MMQLFLKPQKPKKYSIIYCDPCWKYSNVNTGGSFNSGSENHYPTMSIEELCALDVESLVEESAFMFMWVTGPLLLSGEAAQVMNAWGFEPKTIAFVWVKTNADGSPVNGLGFYTRSCVEYVILGKRGRPEVFSHGVRQLIETEEPITLKLPRLRHSEKPPEVRNRIVELCGDFKRLEMFSRHEIKDWDRHGNQII